MPFAPPIILRHDAVKGVVLPSLSLVVITKDEAEGIERCISSVAFADEVVVLDSGSSDGTDRIAEKLGARVIRTDWPGHVAQKNRALDEATCDFVLSLDGDEWLSDAAGTELRDALHDAGDVAFSFPRCNHWLGRRLRHGRWYPDRKVRVIRRGRGRWVGDDPHDSLRPDDPEVALRGDIEHVPYADLSEHLHTIDRYTAIHAEALDARGVRAHWWDVAARPPLHFVNAYLWKRGLLDGVPGLAVAGLGATHVMMKWTRLWLRQHGGER